MDKVFRRAAASWLSRTGGASSLSNGSNSFLQGSWSLSSILTSAGASPMDAILQTYPPNSVARGMSTASGTAQISVHQTPGVPPVNAPTTSDPQHNNLQHKLQHASPGVTSRPQASNFTNPSPQSTQQQGNHSLDRTRLFQTSADTSSPSGVASNSTASTTYTPSSSIHLRFNQPPTFPGPFNIPPSMLAKDVLSQVRDSIFGAPIEPLERTGRRALAKPLQVSFQVWVRV